MNIGDICNHETVFAFKSMSASEAARLMLEKHVGSLVVVEDTDKGHAIVGMLTDRDIVVAVVAHDSYGQTVSVAEIMSSNPITCRIGDSFADVLSLMQRHGIRRVPVIDSKGLLVGIVTMDDLLKTIAKSLQGLVQLIENEQSREAHTRG